MKKCPFCARSVRDEVIDCPYCGRDVDAIPDEVQVEKGATPESASASKQAHATEETRGAAGGCALTPFVAAALLGLAWLTYCDHGFRLYLWPVLGVLGLTSWLWVPMACMSRRPVLQADCPYCGTFVQCTSGVRSFPCPSCAKRVHVRENAFTRE